MPGIFCAPRDTLRMRLGPLFRACAMAEGEDVGGRFDVGENRASGRYNIGGMGDEVQEAAWRHSGVDWREPFAPKYEAVAGGLERLLRGDGILMGTVIP